LDPTNYIRYVKVNNHPVAQQM